ncbi:MAG: DNA recombination protein RmuC [Propionibacteriaceae bacterium]|jgi:DNA recombination protein RmuC|nr:DNA recombination protein RmuC [Propionibacteriaceae bacterium]
MNDFIWVLALFGGLILGVLGSVVVVSVRRAFRAEQDRADIAHEENQISLARGEAANARAEAASARAELARAETDIEKARGEASAAQALASEYKALLAAETARVVTVEVERDNAIEQAGQLRVDHEAMANSFKALSSEALDKQNKVVEAQADQRRLETEKMISEMQSSMQHLQTRLTEMEKERATITAQIAAQVQTVRLTGEQLRKETSSLAATLKRPNARGSWGELQLRRTVEAAGMVEHVDFVLQESASTDNHDIRPDLKVILVGGKFIYVDSKTPLDAFLRAESAESDVERATHLTQFAKTMREHVKKLASKKYWSADIATPDIVILYLPSESLLQVALEQTPDLIDYATGLNVMLATPTTLITMLRVAYYSWTHEVLTESAREVCEIGKQLYSRLSTMGGYFDRLAGGLETAVKAYNDAIGSLEGRIFVSARRFRELKVVEDELNELIPITSGTRSLSAQELVSSAEEIPATIGRARALASVSSIIEDDEKREMIG